MMLAGLRMQTIVIYLLSIMNDSQAEYPDFGSSVELYTCDRFSEIETLSPLTEIAPGNEVFHKEIWRLFEIDKSIDELVKEETVNSYIIPFI